MTTTPVRSPVIAHTSPSPTSVVVYWLARTLLKPIYRVWPLGERGMRALRILETAFSWLPYPSGVHHGVADLGGVGVRTYRPRRSDSAAVADTHVLFLHGGAFLFCGPATHRHVCSRLAETLGAPVYSVNYRQLPEAGVGTSVFDACAAYRALAEQVGGRIVVAGDSAGGFLAAKICELAELDGLPRPAAFVGYSPQLSLDADRHDPALLKHDAYQPLSAVRRAKAKWLRGDIELRGSRTPIDAPVTAFPPTFLTVAEQELLEPDILAFTERLHEGGVPVETHRWRRQVHAFPVLDRLLPESREAMAATGRFLRTVLG
ncbi:alpha/beta hydrolase family protein [Nocardia nova SH22a]|uniref:Alpha/beta hydrolase family protein n=1 Tax=Nocardia nova SH22a TaxID=1415166 RepID=W5TR11_9NOCA|nr:alpha/beta hydrolase [Nocardia nova]AHH21697.1 alpha/beta hydrolase family protein [Nocardia nova SH22a]